MSESIYEIKDTHSCLGSDCQFYVIWDGCCCFDPSDREVFKMCCPLFNEELEEE